MKGTYQPAFFERMADSMSGVSIHGFWGLYAGFVLFVDEDRGFRATSFLCMAWIVIVLSFLVKPRLEKTRI